APGLDSPATAPLPTIKRERGARHGVPSRKMAARLNGKMTFDLVGGGRLMATGTIVPGTAKAFAAEVKKRGGYIKTVMLQSPGGSVNDALAMGRLIRARKFATEVGKDAYCASSCPLVFAAGVKRRAGAKAAIGVHQIYAPPQPGLDTAADGFDSAQRIAATAEGYLRDMGVDLGVWLKAMETPKDELYYFSPAELVKLKLATEAAGAKAKPGAPEPGTGAAQQDQAR
ncbi:MAG: hypothetical protein P8009_09080, partial [Gammaproteobacteria bacterium]